MRKTLLRIDVLSSNAIQAQEGEFHGQARMLTNTINADGNIVGINSRLILQVDVACESKMFNLITFPSNLRYKHVSVTCGWQDKCRCLQVAGETIRFGFESRAHTMQVFNARMIMLIIN